MEFRHVLAYMEKVYQNHKQASVQARSIMDRFGDRSSTSLSLEGFLLYYSKNVVYQPKSVWKDLYYFGFQNDLTRPATIDVLSSDASCATSSSSYSAVSDKLVSLLPAASRDSLLRLSLYEAGMYEAEATSIAVAKRVCYGDEEASLIILKQSLSRLHRTIVEFWSTDTDLILTFIRALLLLTDDLLDTRLREVIFGDNGYLTRYYMERWALND